MPRGFLSKSIGNRSAQSVWAPNNPRISARSSRLLTEEGAQRVPPRGVRSYIASRARSSFSDSKRDSRIEHVMRFFHRISDGGGGWRGPTARICVIV